VNSVYHETSRQQRMPHVAHCQSSRTGNIVELLLGLRSRVSWVFCLAGIIVIGVLSRIVHSGFVIIDKYLGDALYAAMVYVILRLLWRATAVAVGMSAMITMTLVELFQLTMIPAHMLASDHLISRICARLMGTEFSFLDLLAYAAGIACIGLADSSPAR
jgi:hypothetical protein